MTFVELLHKALNDQHFGSLVVSDPHAALKQVGIDPTHEKVEALRAAVHEIGRASCRERV